METALILYTQDNQVPVLVDLYENENISLNWSFNDIKDLAPRGNYSRTFRIPFTQTNASIFGFIQENTIQFSNFNPKRKINASITVDTIPIIEGYVQFKASYTSNGEVSDLEIVFFGNTVNFFKTIGDADFKNYIASELQTDYDFIVSYVTTSAINSSGNVYLGLTDKGDNWVMNVSDQGTRNILSNDFNIVPKVGELTPFVRSRYIFDKIFALSGFELNESESTTLLEQLDKMWIPWIGESDIIAQQGNPDTARFKLTNSSPIILDTNDFSFFNFTVGGGCFVSTLPTLNIDIDSGSNVGANNTYTAPFSGSYVVAGNMTIQTDLPIRGINMGFLLSNGVLNYLMINGAYISLEVWDDATQDFIYNTNTDVTLSTGTSSAFVEEGFTIQPIVYIFSDDYQHALNLNPLVTFTISSFEVGTLDISKPLFGNTIDWSANAPVMKCSEFISSLFKMFNLVVIPDDVNPKLLTLKPIMEYLSQGISKDWSNKLDISKDIILTSTADYQANENLWTYKAMNDYYNQLYNSQGGRVYGRLLLIDPENDFATKEQKTEIMFGATPLNSIKGSDYPIPKFQSANGQFAAPGPRILYRTENTITFNIYNDDFGNVLPYTIDLFSHYTTAIPTIADEDLNFGQETPLHYVDTTPYKTLYQRYWNDYIADIYAPDARIIEAFFALDFADIYQFKFNDKIFIKDAYYRILDISDYVVGMQDSVKVKLIKMVSATPDCLLSPKPVIGIDGNIIWEDSEGETQRATETCCNNYGYYWVGSECYPTPRDSKGRGGRTKMFSDVTTTLSNVETSPVNKSAYIADNAVVKESNERIFVNGNNIFVGGSNSGSIVSGSSNIVVSDLGSVMVLGTSAKAINQGVTFGSGGNYAGEYQSGIIQVSGSGDWTNATTPITLTNDRNLYITVPEESLWYIKIMIVAAHADAITGIDVNITSEFNVHLAESGGLSIKNITQVDSNVHSTTGDVELDLDLVGSTFAPMVYLKNSSYPLTDINIAAQIIYTQYHYE
jgi:hypothetical protein